MAISSSAVAVQCTLHTLGKFELRIGDRLAPPLPTQKARVLLVFLVCKRGNDVARERLLELLWAQSEPERAREGLRTALSSIRHAVRATHTEPGDVLYTDKSIVRWYAGTDFDAARFEELAASRSITDKRAALKLYGGDFLEGTYEEWAVEERERLAALYETLLGQLAAQAADPDAARILLSRDPFNEPAYATLIDAELAAHRVTAASALAAQYRAAMQEIHTEPSAEFQRRFSHLQQTEPRKSARPGTAVPPQSAAVETHLPTQLTSFVGRDDELAKIETLVRGSRLVTVVGTGGIGKTRLAIQAASDLADDFTEGVWFVDLAAASDAAHVVSAIASALAISTSSVERPLEETLIVALQKRRLLLLLDNCEHLLAGVAALAVAILRACAGVRVLATSREPLKANGEEVLRLSALSGDNAVTLFAERARAADKRFELNERTAPAVAAICERLDGIPLAIELAAPRVAVLSPKHLQQRLDDHFRILEATGATALARHKTVRALIDWSYDLLSPKEQALLRLTGVFVGGFTLEAVAALSGDSAADALDVLSSLAAKSLIQVDSDPDNERYGLLQTTLQYARDKLDESGQADSTRARHAGYFLTLMESADREYGAANAREWLARYRLEIDNVRAAIEYACRTGDIVRSAALVAAARELWLELGLHAEGYHRAQLALEMLGNGAPLPLSAGLWLVVAELANVLYLTPQALDASQRAAEAFDALGDETHLPYALQSAGFSLLRSGFYEDAESTLLRAHALAERLGNRRVLLRVILRRAHNASATRNYDRAVPLYERCMRLARALDDELYVGYVTGHLSNVYFAMHDVKRAISSGMQALEIFRERRDSAKESNVLANLSHCYLALNQFEECKLHARTAIEKARESESTVNADHAAEVLAAVAACEGEVTNAGHLLGFADASLARLHFIREFDDLYIQKRALDALREKTTDAEIETLLSEGAALSEDEAFSLALSVLPGRPAP